MLVAASVCPHPPLLVPAAATGAAEETAGLRAACLESVRRLHESAADRVIVVGAADEAGEWDGSAGGSLRRFGVDVQFGGAADVLPPSLTIGAFLLDEVDCPRDRRRFVAVASDTDTDDAAALGRRLAGGAPAAMLVMGDGSAKRTTGSPGYLDDRAEAFDASVVKALAEPTPYAVLRLDPEVADTLWVAGRPAWQVLAGAAQAANEDGASIATAVRYDEAPYGVGYFVVDWNVTAP